MTVDVTYCGERLREHAMIRAIGVGCSALLVTIGLVACKEKPQPGVDALPPLDVQRIAAETSPFQRVMLADGMVTYAEYETATLATIQCLEEAGLDVTGPYPRGGSDTTFLEFDYGPAASTTGEVEGPDRRVLEVGGACEREYRADVARVWASQHVLTDEQREGLRPLVIDCLTLAIRGS